MPENEFKLTVAAIFPNDGGVGTVRFKFTLSGTTDPLTIDVIYAEQNPNDGVKEAAGRLREIAERLAEQAGALAE